MEKEKKRESGSEMVQKWKERGRWYRNGKREGDGTEMEVEKERGGQTSNTNNDSIAPSFASAWHGFMDQRFCSPGDPVTSFLPVILTLIIL